VDTRLEKCYPLLRVALMGDTKGPNLFEFMEIIGREEVNDRLNRAVDAFDSITDEFGYSIKTGLNEIIR